MNPLKHHTNILCALAGLVLSAGSAARGADDVPAYRDPKLPVEARADDLLARMNLDEKVAQLRCQWGD